MSGSSTILQALLPGRSGDVAQRGAVLKKGDQSFASVFEKKIQVRQEKPSLPLAASEVKDRNQPVSERRDPEQAVDRTEKTEKPAPKNPAKEKMKELVKKVKDTLDAMKDPEATPDQLKKLAGELKEALAALQALAQTLQSEGNVQQEIPMAPEVLTTEGFAQTDSPTRREGVRIDGINAGNGTAIQTKESQGRLQTQELKENLMLKEFNDVLAVQGDLIAEDPALKEALKQILMDVKTVLSSETKNETGLTGEVEALLSKLNGMVVKAEAVETDKETPMAPDASEAPTDGIPTAAGVGTSNPQDQQASSEDSPQSDDPQSKQAYGAEIPVEQKNTEESEQPRTTAEKSASVIEKTETAASKPVVQSPVQSVPNPQAFQDTLDAVKEGVQAKTQFQSKIMEQVVETIKMNLKGDDGKTEMLMKLKPESLGNVALKVSIDKGIVLAELQVESQAVKQALESNLQDLRNALQDKGFNVFDLDVSVRKDNQQQNQDSGRSRQGKTAKIEASVDRLEQRLMSLESSYHQSTIDYLG